MIKSLLFSFILFLAFNFSFSQATCTPFSLASATINLPCTQSCFNYSTAIPRVKTTEDYSVQNTPFAPLSYTTGTIINSIYVDDKFSSAIPIPFNFCFYGSNYNNIIVGSNGVVTFDVALANSSNGWPLQNASTAIPIPYAGGTYGSTSPANYPKAAIMGVYHDIDPSVTGTAPDKRIEWRVDGSAPCRKFVISFYKIAMFDCNSSLATSQIILYEGLGIVDVQVESKPLCTTWNSGFAILGMQNFARDKAITAPGKNCTQWTATNEGYRFMPNGTNSLYKKVELLNGSTVVAVGDTLTVNGVFTAIFPSVCQTVATQNYTVRVTYKSCANATDTYIVDGNLTVNKAGSSNINGTSTIVNANCTNLTAGSLTINATGGLAPYQYSLNGGTYQPSNTFTGLTQGTYSIKIKDASGCDFTYSSIVGFTNNLTLTSSNDTTVCKGNTISLFGLANGTNPSYTWSPTTGLSSSNTATTNATIAANTSYTVTASLNGCTKSKQINIATLTPPDVNAGPDYTIIQDDDVQLNGSSLTATSFNWSPIATLTNANTYYPIAKPTVTTTYTLTVKDANTCTNSDQTTVTVIPYCIKVMNSFTPNGDGINDYWLVYNSYACIKQIKANVYNRYGGLIYNSDNYLNKWDGTYKGKIVSDATYYYLLEITLINNKKIFLKGDVTILR